MNTLVWLIWMAVGIAIIGPWALILVGMPWLIYTVGKRSHTNA